MRAVTVSFRIGQGVCDVTRASGVGELNAPNHHNVTWLLMV
jgi:hypothetical protein